MSLPFPLGQRESQQLEFKGAEAKPWTIAREVVAMLNSDGGEVWLGVREQDGIATAFESLGDPEAMWQRLLNYFLDVIEPTPSDEVQKEVLEKDGVLILRATPRKPPYSLLKEGGRHFLKRVDHRIRAMTRDEIFGSSTSEKNSIASVASDLLGKRRDEALSRQRTIFWFGSQPLPVRDLDLQEPRLRELLEEPVLSGNRRIGWSFRCPTLSAELRSDTLELGKPDVRWTRIHRDGGLEFTMPMSGLEHSDHSDHPGEIFSLALLEYVISLARLSAALLPDDRTERVLFDLAFTGGREWKLPPYAQGSAGHGLKMEESAPHALEDDAFLRAEPLSIARSELAKNPDRIGYRLVRDVYQAYGLPEDRIHSAYDTDRQRLILTD